MEGKIIPVGMCSGILKKIEADKRGGIMAHRKPFWLPLRGARQDFKTRTRARC